MVESGVFFVGICFGIWMAIIAQILSLLLWKISPRARKLLPPAAATGIIVFAILIDPGLNLMYFLSLLGVPLLVPLCILAPLPFIVRDPEKKVNTSTRFLVSLVLAWIFYIFVGNFPMFDMDHAVMSILWLAGLCIASFLVFSVLFYVPRLENLSTEKPGMPAIAEKKSQANTAEEWVNIVPLVLLLILLCSPFLLIMYVVNNDFAQGFDVYSVDPSSVSSGTFIQVTDNDLRHTPKLLSIIQDSNANPRTCTEYSKETHSCVIGSGSYNSYEKSRFEKFDNALLEYKGEFYSIRRTWIS